MKAYEISLFREKLADDQDNLNARRSLHEQYEWIEAYWQHRYNGNNPLSKFSKEFESYYWGLSDFRELTREFSSFSPVGSSKRNFDPTESVKQATLYLRHHAKLFEVKFPDIDNEKEVRKMWKKSSFEAILTIVKQVRDNLFHGRKMDLEENKYQRNKELVTMSSNITRLILDKLVEAERT